MDVRTKLRYGLIALSVAATVASAAMAQRPYGGRASPEGRNVAGQFDYYALVLSWSPSHCASAQAGRDALQCERTDGKRYSFVLHGLWPQYAPRGWPQDCPVKGRAFVPRPVITGMLDIMPSDKLVIHEYRKHGTCSGLEPAQYFDFSRKLFSGVTIPDDYRNPFEAKFVSPSDLISDFMKVNPWMKPNMIAVDCSGPGNRVGDVRICFSKEGQPTGCSRNEDQRKMCSADKMYMPPVRATRIDDGRGKAPSSPLPGPAPRGRNI
jgi:ribonuclease T2